MTTTYIVCNKTKHNVSQITTPLGKEIMNKVNNHNLSAKEKFIKAMQEYKGELIVHRDTENEFVAYSQFGYVYEYFNGQYLVLFYPKPSMIPISIIKGLIEEELGCNDYDNVAEMYRFLSLTNEEKDKQGFAFYHWIWEDGLWDDKAKIFSFGYDETDSNCKDMLALAELKRQMECL